jgi:KDO2-lipid IV(A) lauroyltransferase
MKPLNFKNDDTIESITLKLNQILESMILKNPNQWIWSHNRWK